MHFFLFRQVVEIDSLLLFHYCLQRACLQFSFPCAVASIRVFHLAPFFLLSAAAKDVLASVFGIAARGGLVRARVRVGVSAGAGGAGSTPEAGAFASVIATSQSRDSGVPL